MKNLYIIGGCNGASKTSASFTILPEILDCKEYVNADEIATKARIPSDDIVLFLPELAVSRVEQKVREGGHNIPENVIGRRYKYGLKLLTGCRQLDVC